MSIIVPAILGLAFGWLGSHLVDRHATLQERLKSVFSFRDAIVQTAWFQVFNSELVAKIRVTFDDGSVVTGWYAGSASVSKEEPHDMFLISRFEDVKSELKRGLWIPRSKVKAIEIMEFENEE